MSAQAAEPIREVRVGGDVEVAETVVRRMEELNSQQADAVARHRHSQRRSGNADPDRSPRVDLRTGLQGTGPKRPGGTCSDLPSGCRRYLAGGCTARSR